MAKRVRAHAIISGRVQGVCFRLETQRTAKQYGVSGWVRNRYDGTVEAVFEGEEDKVVSVSEWCKKGPALAIVGSVDIIWQDYTGEFDRFDIRR